MSEQFPKIPPNISDSSDKIYILALTRFPEKDIMKGLTKTGYWLRPP